jgi:hypothetical protein
VPSLVCTAPDLRMYAAHHRVLGFGEPRLMLRRDSGLAAGHGADHQCFWIDGGPAGEVGSDPCLDQVDCGGVQVANTESSAASAAMSRRA